MTTRVFAILLAAVAAFGVGCEAGKPANAPAASAARYVI